jgi:hypothetical protein
MVVTRFSIGGEPRRPTISLAAKFGATLSKDAMRRVRRSNEPRLYFRKTSRYAFNSA